MGDEIIEQPQASPKPLSDFNDLHVSEGLGVVREQIEKGISSQLSAFAVSPNPFTDAGHSLGQGSDFEQNSSGISLENSIEPDFSLEQYTEADLIQRENESLGEPVAKGKGEIIDFERPDFTLEKCLSCRRWLFTD